MAERLEENRSPVGRQDFNSCRGCQQSLVGSTPSLFRHPLPVRMRRLLPATAVGVSPSVKRLAMMLAGCKKLRAFIEALVTYKCMIKNT